MKNPIFLFLIVLIIAYNQGIAQQEKNNELNDNEELKTLYFEDQADREIEDANWQIISKRDSLRQDRVVELLDSNKVRTSLDYSNAAMIFQHGRDTIASGLAVKMMRKSIELDSTANKWLLASAIDRDLMRRGKPQIYGTQFGRIGEEPWKRYNLDSTKISDAERREYGVLILTEQKEELKRMNKRKLSELLSSGKSIDDIINFCENEDLKNSKYDLSERAINSFGYQLMSQEKDKDALVIFELNTKLYPLGFNTYDSLGECLVKLGQIEEGIKSYEKSLELNPENKNAETVLTELRKN